MNSSNISKEEKKEYSPVITQSQTGIQSEPIQIDSYKSNINEKITNRFELKIEDMQKQNEDNKENLFETLMNKKGINKLQLEALLFSCLLHTLEGMQSSLTGITFLPILLEYHISGFTGCLVTSFFILFMAFGHLSASYFTSKYGRRKVLIFGQLIIAGISAFAFIKTIFILILSRCIIGFVIGIIIPIASNNLIEILPRKRRSFYINGVTAFFSAGAIIATQILKFVYPKVNLLFIFLSIPPLLFCSLYWISYRDNPRFLLLNGDHEQAFFLLEVFFNDCKRLDEAERVKIAKDVDYGMNKEVKLTGKFEFIFKRYLKITLILSIIWVLFAAMMNGGIFSLFTGIKNSSVVIYVDDQKYLAYLVDVYFVSLKVFQIFYWFLAISTIIGGLLTEIVFIGRKVVVFTGFLIAIVVCFLSLIIDDKYYILFILGAFCINISFNSINTYAMEVYPTRVRDFSIGYLSFIAKISGFFSNIIALYLREEKTKWVFILNGCIAIIGLTFSFFLPGDTKERTLDINMPNKSGEQEVGVNKTSEEIII